VVKRGDLLAYSVNFKFIQEIKDSNWGMVKGGQIWEEKRNQIFQKLK